MHYEIMSGEQIDAVEFHVSSSLKKAESYIKKLGVDNYSWWQIHPYQVDSQDWGNEGHVVHYYTYKGKKVKSAPWKQAIKAYRKSDNPLVVASKLAIKNS